MKKYHRRIVFGDAVAVHKRYPGDSSLSIPVGGVDVSVSRVCEKLLNDKTDAGLSGG